MADDVVIDQDGVGGTDFTAATDEIGNVHYQRVKLTDGTANSTAAIGGDATNGLDVDVTRVASTTAIRIHDGTTEATVRNLAANDALNVAIVDGTGAQVTTFGGSGGTAATDTAAFTAASTQGTPMQAAYESTPTAITTGKVGIVGMDDQRRLKVTLDNSTLDVAHDAPDSTTMPVKIGGKALSAMPTPVATSDRTNANFDLYGKQMVTVMDPGMQVWKQVEATSAQTGTAIWTPTAGKKIAVTSYEIGTGGTTAGLLTIFFAASADTTFTQGTDQVVFRGSLTPSSSATPGVISNHGPAPIFCTTADHVLRYTTVGAITIYITVYGFEF